MEKSTEAIVERFIDIFLKYGVDLIGAIVLLVIGWTIASWARRSVRHALEDVPRMDDTLKPFLAKLVWYVVMVFVLVAVLSQFGVQTTSLIAVLGAAGLAIGFALQGTLSNVASGVMLLFLRPFNTGDYIDAGGIAGTVVEISLFSTEIKTSQGLCLIVPNKIIWESPITNFSRNPTRRFDITVGIGYGDDVDGAMDLLMGLLTGDGRILDDPEPLVMIEELGDNAVIINLRAWAKSGDSSAAVRGLKKAIKVELEAAGYTIPFPRRDIHIVSGDQPG